MGSEQSKSLISASTHTYNNNVPLAVCSSSPLLSLLSDCLWLDMICLVSPDVLYYCGSQESQRAVPCSCAVSDVGWQLVHVSDMSSLNIQVSCLMNGLEDLDRLFRISDLIFIL